MTETTSPMQQLQEDRIWISHYTRCLSFHKKSNFEALEFWDKTALWGAVFQYLDHGYRVC